MERAEIDLPFERLDGTIHCIIERVRHRDKSESITCRTKLENGRKCKLVTKLTPLPKPDSNGHEWYADCLGMQTHTYASERLGTATDFFRFWLGVFTSKIRDDKFVKVDVRIPKGKYCVCDNYTCSMYVDGAGGREYCQLIDGQPSLEPDGVSNFYNIVKHKECPARQKE